MIIDASIAFKLIFPEAGTAQVIRLAGNSTFVAPTLLHSEVANALWRRRLKGEMPDDISLAEPLDGLARIVRTVDEVPLMPRALEMAVALGHPVYDCVYLAVAEALDEELLTADLRFLSAIQGTEHAIRVRELGDG